MLKFASDQLSVWPLARNNFRALKSAQERTLRAGELEVKLVNIPQRSISTNARTDSASLSARPCFLCAANRPPQQNVIGFEGAKNKKYNIQVNPYPILPNHFVIPSVEHTPQSIWHRYVDMLRLAKRRPGFTIIYNGPCSGASAPDHFHFQAVPSNVLPLENDIRTLRRQKFITNVSDARLFEYSGYVNGVFAIWGRSSKSMNRMFYRLLDCADILPGDTEPRFNLYTFRQDSMYCTVVLFRTSHRSNHYFSEDPARHLSMSPGCVDMGGIFVTIDKSDFGRLDDEMLADMLGQITISAQEHKRIVKRLTRGQKRLEVRLLEGTELEFELLSDGAGVRKAVLRDGKVEYGGIQYDELYFDERNPSTMFAEPSFVLDCDGVQHSYAGALRIRVSGDKLLAVNIIGMQDYLRAVLQAQDGDYEALAQKASQLGGQLLQGAEPRTYCGLTGKINPLIDKVLDENWTE